MAMDAKAVLVACALCCAAALSAYSGEVSIGRAYAVAGKWISLLEALESDSFNGKQPNSDKADTCEGQDGAWKFHVFPLSGGGYVVTSADTRIAPILAYSPEGEFAADDGNPLYRLLVRDVAGRVNRLGTEDDGLWSGNTNEWARLYAKQSSAHGAADLRVAPPCVAEPGAFTNIVVVMGGSFADEQRAMLPGFDLGLPCGVRLADDSRIAGDGYGYSAGRLHIHLDFGSFSAWYVPAEEDERDPETPAILGVEYNIYPCSSPDGVGHTAVGGRVLGVDGKPLSGVAVTATNRRTGEAFDATSGENGIYAFLLPPNATYVFSVEDGDLSARTVRRVGHCVSNAAVANLHGVDLALSSEPPPEEAWLDESAAMSQITGEWSGEVEYGENGKALIEAYASELSFTPFSASSGDLVTVSVVTDFEVCEEDVTPDETAQAAVRLGPDGLFQVWAGAGEDAPSPGWLDVEAEGVAPTSGREYTLSFTFDYTAHTYSVEVNGSALQLQLETPTASFPLACSADRLTSISFKGEAYFASLYGECVMVATGFEEDEVVLLKDSAQVVLDAAKAEWLNKCAGGDKSAVQNAAAGLTEKEFSDAYLLNVDVAGDRSCTFKITGMEVTASEVAIEVELTRPGKLEQPINGVLKFYGASALAAFKEKTAEPIASTTLVDDNFSEGDTATATFQKDGNTFFNAEIVHLTD